MKCFTKILDFSFDNLLATHAKAENSRETDLHAAANSESAHAGVAVVGTAGVQGASA